MSKNRKLFLADYCLTPFDRIPSGGILCENGKIIAIGGASAFSMCEEHLEIVKVNDAYALPGFIDSHIHGIGPLDTAHAADPDFSLAAMSHALAAHGVTTYVPTLISLPRDKMLATVEALADQIEKGCPDSDPQGMHIEGPFLNPEKRGSQDLDCILPIDLVFAGELIAAGKNHIKVMTFAPELDLAPELVELLLENGVIPSMGHSLANEEQTLRCVDAGCTRSTYIFNGMPVLYHRESTLTTLALTDDRISVEMIVDGLHLHPRMIDLTARCKPKEKIIGISNAVSTGTKRSASTAAQIVKTESGIISGATLTLENSWLHLMNFAHLEQSVAAACFTHNPALDLGLITRGELRPGKRADITFFDSRTNQVRMTVSRGEIIYDREKDQEPGT